VYVAGPLAGAVIAVGCAMVLRGRGGDVTSRGGRLRRAGPGRPRRKARLSEEIEQGKVVPEGMTVTGTDRSGQ